jgi:hypothetical protein
MSEAVANLTMFTQDCKTDVAFIDEKKYEAENDLRERNKQLAEQENELRILRSQY